MKKITLYLCYLLLLPDLLNAQPIETYNSYKTRFPDEDGLIVKKKKEINIDYKNDRPYITSNEYEEVFWLTDKALYQRKDVVYYGMFDNLLEISAKTLVPKGNTYKEFNVEEFTKTDYLESGIFYDDVKIVTFNYPNMASGCRTIKEYQKEIGDPHFLGSFYFDSYFHTLETELRITAPASVTLNYKLINCENTTVEYSEVKKGNKITYIWKSNNLKKLPNETNSPGHQYTSPHVIVYIEKYVINGITAKVFSSTSDLHSWYSTLVENVNTTVDSSLLQCVDSLCFGLTTDIEKAKKIYYWVQDHIKYIAIEYGMGGFRPRPANIVFHRRYGDCKDMANLIYYMLKLSGVNAYITWIGTRDIPYSYNQVHTPVVDNHMIVTCIIDSNYYFLDATGGYLPIGFPSSFIQGKEALINISSDEYEIVDVPEMEASENVIIDSVNMTFTGKDVTGCGNTSFSGYYDVYFNALMDRLDMKDMSKNLKDIYPKGSNKYQITSQEVFLDNDRYGPSRLDYQFKLPDYFIQQDSNIYINLNLDKSYLQKKIEKDRKNDYVFPFKKTIMFKTILDVPPEYTVQHIPSNIEKDFDQFKFSIDYAVADDKIIYTHKIVNHLLILNKDQMEDWNSMIFSLQGAYGNYVILMKK